MKHDQVMVTASVQGKEKKAHAHILELTPILKRKLQIVSVL